VVNVRRGLLSLLTLIGLAASPTAFDGEGPSVPPAGHAAMFQTSDRCVACHNGLATSTGDDISIGLDWRTTLMANSSRDPYWQASVRRETLDHPSAAAAIEDECSICHMPIARYRAMQRGESNKLFALLALEGEGEAGRQAQDGVTCSVCHQIAAEKLGTPSSFNGGFVVAGPDAAGTHAEYGPWDIDPGLQRVMRSSTGGFEPRRGEHLRSSELCATCHTLTTKALGPDGQEIGALPEQMPYAEWLHSDYRESRSCQSCHMPLVSEEAAFSRVLGERRSEVRRHQFLGANFLMQRMFSRYHDQSGMAAQPQELASAAEKTIAFLQSQSAHVSISSPQLHGGRLEARVSVENIGGHKLPTAYPSRRAWLHVTVRDRSRRVIFESGALNGDGSIRGNDNDADATRYEPHYTLIRSPEEVQIYESVLRGAQGEVTTGLLAAVGYLKDNRVLPHGFDKGTAASDVAVHGEASSDARFTDKGHALDYSIAVGNAQGPFEIEAELRYQPIGFRWARNLKPYAASEPQRFTVQFESMAEASAVTLARAVGNSE
jgi:hypothetical protein